ncbi:MAG: DUF5657 family protein [bacterium]
MIDLIIFKFDPGLVVLWSFKIIFLLIGIVYVIYVLLQLRQIGIMNSTLKTKGGIPIAIMGIFHILLVLTVLFLLEIMIMFGV